MVLSDDLHVWLLAALAARYSAVPNSVVSSTDAVHLAADGDIVYELQAANQDLHKVEGWLLWLSLIIVLLPEEKQQQTSLLAQPGAAWCLLYVADYLDSVESVMWACWHLAIPTVRYTPVLAKLPHGTNLLWGLSEPIDGPLWFVDYWAYLDGSTEHWQGVNDEGNRPTVLTRWDLKASSSKQHFGVFTRSAQGELQQILAAQVSQYLQLCRAFPTYADKRMWLDGVALKHIVSSSIPLIH